MQIVIQRQLNYLALHPSHGSPADPSLLILKEHRQLTPPANPPSTGRAGAAPGIPPRARVRAKEPPRLQRGLQPPRYRPAGTPGRTCSPPVGAPGRTGSGGSPRSAPPPPHPPPLLGRGCSGRGTPSAPGPAELSAPSAAPGGAGRERLRERGGLGSSLVTGKLKGCRGKCSSKVLVISLSPFVSIEMIWG